MEATDAIDQATDVAQAVRAEMARGGVSQQIVADAIGLSQAGVSRRITGEVPFTAPELKVIANLLGIRVGVFFGEVAAA